MGPILDQQGMEQGEGIRREGVQEVGRPVTIELVGPVQEYFFWIFLTQWDGEVQILKEHPSRQMSVPVQQIWFAPVDVQSTMTKLHKYK